MQKIPLAGVIGAPISHSRSPKLHNYWLRQHNINGYYIPLHIEPHDFESAVREMVKMGFVGCNVTIPNKINALQLADDVTDRARMIGAANTLWFEGDKIFADNTDAYGFISSLRQQLQGWSGQGKTAYVIGAGGAARAVIVALLTENVHKVKLTNRSPDKAEQLAAEFGDKIEVIRWENRDHAVQDIDLLVNTTALGMASKPPLELNLSGISLDCIVYDIVYEPLETPLLTNADRQGCRTVDGLGMLIHQAVPGFEKWFGIKPVVDELIRKEILT